MRIQHLSVPEAKVLNQTNNSLNSENLQLKLYGKRGMLHNTQRLPVPLSQMKRQWKARGMKWGLFCLPFVLFVFH